MYYILRHIVYDETEKPERFVLIEFGLKLIKYMRKNANEIDNIINGMLNNKK